LVTLTRELQQKNEELSLSGFSKQDKQQIEAVGKRAEELEEKLKSLHDKFLSDGATPSR